VYISQVSDPTIVLDSWRSTNTYGYANAGSIMVVMNEPLDFEINGAASGSSYINNCFCKTGGGGCILLYNTSLGGAITVDTSAFTATTAYTELSTGGFWYIHTTTGDVTITQDAFVGSDMSAANGGYMFARTLNGNVCYTCTGICSWTDIDVTNLGGAFWMHSTDDACFYINDGAAKTMRNISSVSRGGFIYVDGTDDLTFLIENADIDNVSCTTGYGGFITTFLDGDLTFSIVNSDVDDV